MGQVIYLHRFRGLKKARAANRASLIVGAWLLFAAVAIDFGGATIGRWNHVLVGATVVLLAGARASRARDLESISWLIGFMGLWLVAAPFVLDYSSAGQPTVNSILAGLMLLGLAVYSGYETSQSLHAHARPDEHSSGRHAV